MRHVAVIEEADQAAVALQPLRLAVLRSLSEPRSCTEVAKELGQAPQKVYYHVKVLEAAGLVEQVGERRVRGINEGIYRASAEAFWLSLKLVRGPGDRRSADDRRGLAFLLSIAEGLQADVARLAAGDDDVASLGMTGELRLAPERREEFRRELQRAFEELLGRYDTRGGETYRLAIACYPRGDDDD